MKLLLTLLAGLPIFTVLPVLHSQVVASGLVDYYSFDGNLDDSSGNGYNLSVLPGAVFNYVPNQDGTPGGAVQLVSAGPSGTFFDGIGPELADESSSVSFWVEKNYIGDGTNGSWVFGLGDPVGVGGSGGNDMHVALDYGQSIRYSFFYDDLNSNYPLPNDQWVNITATYDYPTGTRDIYVDGTLVDSDVATSPFTGSDNLKIGYDGISLSDFAFYDTTLTPAQVEEIASGSVPEGGWTALYLAISLLTLASLPSVQRRISCLGTQTLKTS